MACNPTPPHFATEFTTPNNYRIHCYGYSIYNAGDNVAIVNSSPIQSGGTLNVAVPDGNTCIKGLLQISWNTFSVNQRVIITQLQVANPELDA